ncbi:MAG TPA: hypothetical protein EYP14_01885 [Planctomycetaceae bacterium]|nr:hypothetical protein [Planctomycetaceae bacterium]
MTKNNESPKSLVVRALQGEPVPRPPLGPLAVHYCAQWAGISLERYSTDPVALADSVIAYWERFQPDAAWLSADTWVTAEAMGAKVDCPGADQPLCGTGEPVVRTAADVDRIPRPDPATQGRWPIMLQALARIRARLGEHVFLVACFDQYPFSLACALMGINEVMVKLLEDRSLVAAVMERGLEYAEAYAHALAAAGADLLSGGDSPAGMLGPDLYTEIAWPFEKRLIERLKASVRVPVSLHICGDTRAILEPMARTDADVLEIDWQVEMPDACRTVGSDVALWGNLDPVGLLARGTPQQVREAASRLIRAVRDCGHHRFVVSSGCTLAVDTPAENLDALSQVVRDLRLD